MPAVQPGHLLKAPDCARLKSCGSNSLIKHALPTVQSQHVVHLVSHHNLWPCHSVVPTQGLWEVGWWWRVAAGGGKEATVDSKENILCVKVAHRFITLPCDTKGVLCCHTLQNVTR